MPFKLHTPSRAIVVTEDEAYEVGYGGSMPWADCSDDQANAIVNDVRAKRTEGRKVRVAGEPAP
jgi:hypothetical protein